MNNRKKIAFVARLWNNWNHRLLAGALSYIESHPCAQVRAFTVPADARPTAVEAEAWGADGILAALDSADQTAFLGGLSRSIPMVNTALAQAHPDVVTVIADFHAFLNSSISHLRHLGVRSFALLLLDDSPSFRTNLGAPFLQIAKPPLADRAVLYCPVRPEQFLSADAAVEPIPAPLARWLHELPKPTGILCPAVGSGNYLIRCCKALAIRVPHDIAVVCGDDMDFGLASDPTQTAVVPDLESIGAESLRILTDMIAGKRPPESFIRLGFVTLKVRESTGLRRAEICDVGAALQCIHDNACRGLTVAEVLKQTQHVSRVTFNRRFKEVVGKTPSDAIHERKLDETRRLLSFTALPLGMISELCGFVSASEMARQFRAALGITPRDFRKKSQPVNGKTLPGAPVQSNPAPKPDRKTGARARVNGN
jgi:LacI family transcriptional regulator